MNVKFLIKDLFRLISYKYKTSCPWEIYKTSCCEKHKKTNFEYIQLEASLDVLGLLKLGYKILADPTFNIPSFTFTIPSFNISKLSDFMLGLFCKNISIENPMGVDHISFWSNEPEMFKPITAFFKDFLITYPNLPSISRLSLENHIHHGFPHLINPHSLHFKVGVGIIILSLAGIFLYLSLMIIESILFESILRIVRLSINNLVLHIKSLTGVVLNHLVLLGH